MELGRQPVDLRLSVDDEVAQELLARQPRALGLAVLLPRRLRCVPLRFDSISPRFENIRLAWIGLDRIGLDWIGLDKTLVRQERARGRRIARRSRPRDASFGV